MNSRPRNKHGRMNIWLEIPSPGFEHAIDLYIFGEKNAGPYSYLRFVNGRFFCAGTGGGK